MNRGDLTTYISILGKHSSIVFGHDISSQIVDEFSIFSGPLEKVRSTTWDPHPDNKFFPLTSVFWRRKLNYYPNLPQWRIHTICTPPPKKNWNGLHGGLRFPLDRPPFLSIITMKRISSPMGFHPC